MAASENTVKPAEVCNPRLAREIIRLDIDDHSILDSGHTGPAVDQPAELVRFGADNPFRPPAWRWQLAKRLIESGRKLTRARGDSLVAKTVRFQKAMQETKNPIEQLRLAESEPHLFAAWRLWSAGHDDGLRHAIELLVLAAADPRIISQETAIRAEAIQLFEQLFFDVRGRPPSAITHIVIRPTEINTAAEATLVAKRELAYVGGVDFALNLIHSAFEKCRPRNPEDLSQQLARDTRTSVKLQAAVAMRSVSPTDTQGQLQLVRWSLALQVIERRHRAWREENAATARQLSAGVQAMVHNLPLGLQKTFEDSPAVAVE